MGFLSFFGEANIGGHFMEKFFFFSLLCDYLIYIREYLGLPLLDLYFFLFALVLIYLYTLIL